MCGIIGYTGFRDAPNVLVDCLKRLEYRGYDSAGISVLDDDHLKVHKAVGEIVNLEKTLPSLQGSLGIGHTRWATHGEVNKTNAHPHVSMNRKIALIHNGIIENFQTIKDELTKKGYRFVTQTDSEVLVNLIQDKYHGNLESAVRAALQKVTGSYAVLAISEDEPNKIVGARKESPLVIGLGDNENFLASDVPAFLKYTNRVLYLDDGELCVLDKQGITIMDAQKTIIEKPEHIIDWDIADAEKAGFPHFMLKEIYDQPDAINQILRGRISEIDRAIHFDESVERLLNHNHAIEAIHIIACGTSYYAGLIGKYLLEKLAGVPVLVELASEYRFFSTKNEKSLVIAVTQSGETLDTLAALKEAKHAGCKTLVITNVIGSTATRIADGYILQQSGPEIGVAATKTFTSQTIVLLLLALKIGLLRDHIGSDEIYRYILHLKELPRQVRLVLERSEAIQSVARHLSEAYSVFYIGRGINYPLSLEGALKLKEISYIHAEGFAAGELKHGPFALLTKDTPVVAVLTRDETYEKLLANIGEVKARGPPVIAVADDDDTDIEKYADFVLRYPTNPKELSFCCITVVLQLLAYYVAEFRECSIDKPRNLAKSVTVE